MEAVLSETTISKSQLLTTEEAAEFLGLAAPTLVVWRSVRRYDLRFVRVGRRIRYRLSDLEEWITSRTEGGDAVGAGEAGAR